MPGEPTVLGPFTKGLHNSAGTGEYIQNDELFELVNLEVDTDGSLANRPAIQSFQLPDPGFTYGTTGYKIIGVFQPTGGQRCLVVSTPHTSTPDDYYAVLVNADTNAYVGKAGPFTYPPACGVQYKDKFYVYMSPEGTDQGGYFAANYLWTAVDLPGGQAEACVMYKERIFAVRGVHAATNSSRMYFSNIGDPTDFAGTNWFDFEPGNGQKITNIVVLNNDLVVFKEHSTYRAGYTSDVQKMEISTISTTIGSPYNNCVVVYGNNTIYILHDNSVYEMYNYSFTKISSGVAMIFGDYTNFFDDKLYSLSLFRNRLFVRYYGHLYVLSLLSGRWCEWETTRNFSELVVVPDTSGDTAFAAPISKTPTSESKAIYRFKDDRLSGVQTDEDFECRITTKTYDFDLSHAYKVLFWWGMTIATSGGTHAAVQSPNAMEGPTWEAMGEQYTWQAAYDAGIPWSSAVKVLHEVDIPASSGGYSRKFLKFPKKMRFRQVFFQVSTKVRPNSVGDAAVRIYNITTFLKPKETVVRETTA